MYSNLVWFWRDERGVTSLEIALIVAVLAIACTDVLVSRSPMMAGEISQVSRH